MATSAIKHCPFFYISRTTLIRDDMPLLQSINAKRFRTFGEMALDFVKNQISCFQLTSVVLDIFDRYDIQNSIKKAERDLFEFIDCNKGMSSLIRVVLEI
jgi:hypothetical protein